MKSRMIQITHKTIVAFALSAMVFTQCSDRESFSLHDPNYESPNEDPVISSISPSAGYLSGVDDITITGQNFLSDSSKVGVYFNGLPGLINAVNNTTIRVRPNGNVAGDSVKIKVMVQGAENFSNVYSYKLDQPLQRALGLADNDFPWAITSDNLGNFYAHVVNSSIDQGIIKFDPLTNTTTNFQTPPTAGARVLRWNALKFGKDGLIYGVRGPRAVFKNAGGNVAFSVAKQIPSGTLFDLDFDASGNMWVGGGQANVYFFDMTNPATNAAALVNPIGLTSVRSIRIVGTTLYVAGVNGTDQQVWTYTINGDNTLSNGAMLINLTTNYSGVEILSMTIDSNGSVYLGVSAQDGILVVAPNGTSSYLYPGVIAPRVVNMFWDNDRTLYIINERTTEIDNSGETPVSIEVTPQRLFGLNMLEKRRATYHGIE